MGRMDGRRAALALLFGLGSALPAAADHLIVSANDAKFPMVEGSYRVADQLVPDTLTVLDAASLPPRVVGQVEVQHSVTAPPFAVALSHDEKLALVSAPNKVDPNDKTKVVVEKFLQVVDLEASPPKLVDRVALPYQPIGVSINRAGDLALAAHFEGAVSVLSIKGKKAELVETLKLGNEKSRVSHAAFTPDGKFALVTRRGDDVVSVLAVDGTKVTDTKQEITVGNNPYGMDIAPTGRWAAVANIGRSSGDADSVTLIDLSRQPFRAVSHFAVAPTPEGIAFSPDGELLAVGSINGTNKASNSPLNGGNAKLTVFSLKEGKPLVLAEAPTGHNSQGVVFTPDGKHILVQNYVEKELALYRLDGGALQDTGERVKLTGHPAAIRSSR